MSDVQKRRRRPDGFNWVHRWICEAGVTIFAIYELLKLLKYLYQLW